MTDVLTPKGEATRQRIIEAAAEEMRENGVAVTTLDDVRSRARVSKGQVFHYFPTARRSCSWRSPGSRPGGSSTTSSRSSAT